MRRDSYRRAEVWRNHPVNVIYAFSPHRNLPPVRGWDTSPRAMVLYRCGRGNAAHGIRHWVGFRRRRESCIFHSRCSIDCAATHSPGASSLMRAIFTLAGFAVLLPVGIRSFALVMNYSNSVPLGLYRVVPANSANRVTDYAGFCLSSATARAALRAGLQTTPGDCPSRLAPILKPVICPSAEHSLIYDARGFSFAGKLLRNTVLKARSRTGIPLEHYPFGVYTSGIWALSDFNPNSYDSRYFGPVAADAIRFYAKPVWTW